MLCVNKCDRAIATAKDRLEEGQVENEMFDLLCALNADDEQLEYSTLYASAKQGWAVDDPSEIEETMSSAENPGFQVSKGMEPLLRELVSQVPAPSIISIDGVEGEGDDERDGDAAPFRFTVNNLAHDQFIGTLLTGKVHSGSAKVGDSVRVLPRGTKNGVAVGFQFHSAPHLPFLFSPLSFCVLIFCLATAQRSLPPQIAKAPQISLRTPRSHTSSARAGLQNGKTSAPRGLATSSRLRE